MDYLKHYNLLMERAPTVRPTEGYYERHRIKPACMGGKYVQGNIAFLTAEEHYLAHQLLVKIYPKHTGLIQAAVAMVASPGGHSHFRGNKLYGWLRRRASAAKRGKVPWNKGLTKTDPRVAKNALGISVANRGKPAHNKGIPNPTLAERNRINNPAWDIEARKKMSMKAKTRIRRDGKFA